MTASSSIGLVVAMGVTFFLGAVSDYSIDLAYLVLALGVLILAMSLGRVYFHRRPQMDPR